MTMPAGWKNTSTKMTLAQWVENLKNQRVLAVTAVYRYVAGESLEGARPAGYTPTGYNFVTGETILETQVFERQEIMRQAREYAYTADDTYQNINLTATKKAMRAYFSMAYILFWKLYRITTQIFDLPLCMEQCLTKLSSIGPTRPKNIL
jgi:hypothetical protein